MISTMPKSKLNSLSYLQTNKSQLNSCRSLNQPPRATDQCDARTNGAVTQRSGRIEWWTGFGIPWVPETFLARFPVSVKSL